MKGFWQHRPRTSEQSGEEMVRRVHQETLDQSRRKADGNGLEMG